MKYLAQNQHSLLRKAVVFSLAIHLVSAAILIVCSVYPSTPERNEEARIDTRIRDVHLTLDREESPTFTSLEVRQVEKVVELPQTQQSEPSQVTFLPTVRNPQGQLPPGMIAIIRRSQQPSTPGEPGPSQQADSNIRPVGAAASTGTLPLHGAMKPEQLVVYILDCSGSMGEFGKLDLARASLVATLNRQPATLHFQVIPYNSNARPLFPGGFTTIATNLGQAEAGLTRLEAAGRSNHIEALRVAAGLRPDAIIWLTDADDFPAAKLKQVLGAAGKTTPVYVAEVTARGVKAPRELR